MKTIVILKGLPASGKSTYAKELVQNNPGKYKRINRDLLRQMFDNDHLSNGNEKFIRKVRDQLIVAALENGKHVIVDDTNLAAINEKKIRDIAKEYRASTGQEISVRIKSFDVDVEECIRRDALRAKPVGRAVIEKMYREHFLNTQVSRDPKYREQDPNLPKAILCDLDGTLALMNGRNPFDASSCENDLPNSPVVNLVKQYANAGFKIILLSGRVDRYMAQTKKWLEKYGIPYDDLFMRKDGDNRKDAIIKRELFESNIEKRYTVEVVLDDRNQVVNMWRLELNLPCFQVYYGDF